MTSAATPDWLAETMAAYRRATQAQAHQVIFGAKPEDPAPEPTTPEPEQPRTPKPNPAQGAATPPTGTGDWLRDAIQRS